MAELLLAIVNCSSANVYTHIHRYFDGFFRKWWTGERVLVIHASVLLNCAAAHIYQSLSRVVTLAAIRWTAWRVESQVGLRTKLRP
jgi:hypothetical protein